VLFRSREKLSIPENKKVLLFFGMIKKVKGLEVLLKAMTEVKKKHPDILLVIAGKIWENDFTLYQEIINENNLQDFCLLHTKFIPQEDVAHYYCASDLVVLPYKKIYQSGVLMMTLSYEKPALASNLPPLKEVINDNVNGFLFESETPASLSEKINNILSDENLLEQVRKNGAELVKTKYCWNEIGRQTKAAYQTL
jgi:glycosyltransferase involved in cell wall biosynthesis